MSERNTVVVDVTRVTIVSGDGPVGPRGKSAYQSYLETTSDDPVLSEEAWSTAAGGTTINYSNGIASAILGGAMRYWAVSNTNPLA